MAYIPPLNGGRINASIDGNTAGVKTLVSTGTLTLVGGNNVTLSQSGNAISIVGPTVIPGIPGIADGVSTVTNGTVVFGSTNIPGAVTFGLSGNTITAGAPHFVNMYASGNTTFYSAGSISMSQFIVKGAGAASVGYSEGGLLISTPLQSVQTQNLHNLSLSGNTSGALAQISSGTLTLAGGNNITLSQNGNAITISGANAPSGSINFSAGTTSNSLAAITFSNSNGVSFGLNGSTMTASHNGLTSQSNQVLSASNGSFAYQTAGFSNANGVTFGTSAGSIMTASVATTYAASNHSHGDPTLNLTNISGTTASASNGLTLSLSAANQTNQNVSLYGLGNTTQNSSTLLNASNLSFNGLGGATVGFSNGSIQISGAQTVAQTNQTIGIYATGGNTTGQSSSNTIDARSFSISAQGGLYAGMSGNTLQLSVAPQTAYSFSNGGGVSFGTNGSTVTASVATTYAASNHSHGNPTLNLTNLSGTTASASNGLTLSLSAASQTVQTQNMASVLGSSGNISFANANNVTFGGNASTVTASASFNQTNQNVSLYALGNTTQNSSTLLNASNLSFNGLGGATVGFSNGSIQISGATGGAGGGGVGLYDGANSITSGTARISAGGALTASVNGQTLSLNVPAQSNLSATGILSISTNGSTISIGAPAFSAGMSTIGNTAGTTGTVSNQVIFAGGNNITLSQSTGAGGNTITISGAAQSVQTQNMVSVLGSSGNISFANANNVTFGGNASTVTASASFNQTNQTMGFYATGNTTQNSSTTFDARSLTFNGLGGVSVGYSSGSIQISGAAGGAGGGIALANSQTTYATGTANLAVAGGALTIASTTGQSFNFSAPQVSSLSATGLVSIVTNGNIVSIGAAAPTATIQYYQNMDRGTTATLAVPMASLMIQRLNQENDVMPGYVTANTVLLNMTANMTATSLSSAHTVTVSIGLYTDNATNLSLINSASSSWALGAATGNTSAYNGPRWLSFVASQWSTTPTLDQGGEYVFGLVFRSSSYAPPLSYIGQNYMQSNQRSGSIGVSLVTNTTLGQGNYWNGVLATTALPTGITGSQVNRNNASAIFMPHIILNNRYSGTI